MNDRLTWLSVSRQDLPKIVAEGFAGEPIEGRREFELQTLDDVVLGVVAGADRPCLAVLREDNARQTLAWLATYSPATFPLSQTMRVVSQRELHDLTRLQFHTSRNADTYLWACILLGELLGQAELSTGVEGVPLTLTSSCFTFAQARVELTFGGSSELSKLCEQRLKSAVVERHLSKRAVSMADLQPIWDWARSDGLPNPVLTEIVAALTALKEDRRLDQFTHSRLSAFGFSINDLAEGPAESRVRAFERFSHSITGVSGHEMRRTVPMLLAAAAIAVGNGTGHITLLQEYAGTFPAAYAWFGLFAGAGGPPFWDPNWNRAVNTAARVLRTRFSYAEPSVCDLSWLEADFALALPDPIEFLKHIPTQSQRALAVEIVPGAVLQFRRPDDSLSARATIRVSAEARGNVLDETSRKSLHNYESLLRDHALELEEMRVRTERLLRDLRSSLDQPSLFDPPTNADHRGLGGRKKKKTP